MKKCIHCGQEIPDDAVFCGFCGTRQPEEKNENTETASEDVEKEASAETEKTEESRSGEKPSEPSVTEEKPDESSLTEKEDTSQESEQPASSEPNEASSEKKETVSQETKPEETEAAAEQEKTDAGSDAEADQPADSGDEKHEIRDAAFTEKKEPVKEKPEEAENSSSGKEEKPEENAAAEKEKKKPHLDGKKISLPETHFTKADFNVLLAVLKEPDKDHSLNNTAAGIILVFAWIANWIAFGSFGNGFFSLVLVMIGLIFIDWLTRKDHVTFGQTVRDSAEVISAPSVLVFLGGLFIRNIREGAEVYAFHSIFTTAFIGLFFLTAALILLVITIVRKYERSAWQMTVILTIFLSLLAWLLATSGSFVLL